MTKINIRESLKHLDEDTFCKYDLTTLYDSCVLDDKDKKLIAKMLYDKEDPEVIYQKLCIYFDDDEIAEIDEFMLDTPTQGKYESIIKKCVDKLSETYKDVKYNDVANQLEFTDGNQQFAIGLCPFTDIDTDDYELFIDYNYDTPCCFNTEQEVLKYILNFIKNKINHLDDSDVQTCDDNMVYTVYDIIEDDNRLTAKCMNESTNDFKDIKLGKIKTEKVIELINNMLNNPDYKVTDAVRQKIAKNSAPWGLAVQMAPSVDVDATNSLLSTGDFSGQASFGESIETNFEKDDRVTDGGREGTVLDSDSQKVLVEWDYSETNDIEWIDKSDLSFVECMNEFVYHVKTKTNARKLVDKAKSEGKKLSIKDAEEIVDQSFNDKSDNIDDFYKSLDLEESSQSDYNLKDGWTDNDIKLHQSINWKDRNYMDFPVDEDSFTGTAVLYGTGNDRLKNVEMIKYLRANPLYPPYYAPKKSPFKQYSNVVGPMYDGRKHNSYQVHDRYETQELYDTLFESATRNDKLKIKMFDCPRCHNKTLVDIDNYVVRNADVDYHDQFVCDECGAELLSEPQVDGTIRFVNHIQESKEEELDFQPSFDELRKQYKNYTTFKDKEKNSGLIRDLCDQLENKKVSYDIYNHKKDSGMTIFYDDFELVEAVASYKKEESKNIVAIGKEARKYLDNKVNNTSLEDSKGYWKIQKDLVSGGDLTIVADVDDIPRGYKYRFSFDDINTGTTLNMDAYSDYLNWYIVDDSVNTKLIESNNEDIQDKVKFSYAVIEFVEGGNEDSSKKKRVTNAYKNQTKFTDLDKLGDLIYDADADVKFWSDGYGYDKCYVDVYGEINGELVKYHGIRYDLGDNLPRSEHLSNFDIPEIENVLTKEYLERRQLGESVSNITLDMWYNDDVKDVDKIDVQFYDNDATYRGNLYIGNKMVGDYSTKDSVALEKQFPQFNWSKFWNSQDLEESTSNKITDQYGNTYDKETDLYFPNIDTIAQGPTKIYYWDYSDPNACYPDWEEKEVKVDVEISVDTEELIQFFLENADELEQFVDKDGEFDEKSATKYVVDNLDELIEKYEGGLKDYFSTKIDEKAQEEASDYFFESLKPYQKEEFKKQLQDDLYDSMLELFKTPDWGYEDIKEIDDIINPIVEVEDYKGEYNFDFKVEVRAELNYPELEEVCTTLDKVIQKYDKQAYFEPVTSGIADAYMKFPKKLESFTESEILSHCSNTWEELIKFIESSGYEVDSINRRNPSQWITAYKDDNEYEIEINKYFDGTYEVIKADLVGSITEANDYIKESEDYPEVNIHFVNNRKNGLPGISNERALAKTFNETGLDKFKTKLTNLENVSIGDIKDTFGGTYFQRHYGWTAFVKSEDFNNYLYIKKVALTEDLDEAAKGPGVKITGGTCDTKWIYDTMSDSISMSFVINNIPCEFKFSPNHGRYIVDGVDCNHVKFEGDRYYKDLTRSGGTARSYALNIPGDVLTSQPDQKQKDYRFTGQYYSTTPAIRYCKESLKELLTQHPDYFHNDILDKLGLAQSLEEASYGEAFDIEDDQYFTKEDIVDLADEICERLYVEVHESFDVSDLYIENNVLHIELESDSYLVQTDVKIDMRKIRKPMNIMKYALPITNKLLKEIKEQLSM